MSSKLMKFKDTNVLFEVETVGGQPQEMSKGKAKSVDNTLDKAFGLVKDVAEPFVNTWEELSKDSSINEAEVEISLGFEAEGNFFIAKSKASTSIKVTLKLSSEK